jgi:hypothetical protein
MCGRSGDILYSGWLTVTAEGCMPTLLIRKPQHGNAVPLLLQTESAVNDTARHSAADKHTRYHYTATVRRYNSIHS